MATTEVNAGSVEALEKVLSYLVRERQRLRTEGAGRAELEANRLAIVSIQSHHARALGQLNARRAV